MSPASTPAASAPATFAPIAIVGRACVLPGALNPAQLWQAVAEGRDLISSVDPGRWGLEPNAVLCTAEQWKPDYTWSNRGGYVRQFDSVWNPEGFAVPATELAGLDPLFHWTLHCARAALAEAKSVDRAAVGAIFGNLGFPSEGMAAYAQSVWTGHGEVDRRNRHISGGCAELLSQALQLGRGSFCLDAACASSLYAIKLACDRLHDGEADLMLAGAVQRADDLFLHLGFSALNALSRSGRSRPFHRDADGLLPAEGAAFFALKRLQDARRDGDRIHGVIRGIGLSNDGRGKGMLVPDESGQRRAIRQALAVSAIEPQQVSLLECHATGTTVGDATELRSSAAEYAGAEALPIGSLKSNLGHLITVAGAAGLIKLLEAMRAGQRPPTLHAEAPTSELQNTPFRLLTALEDWPSTGPRIAALSAFGFGGNNAHLLLSEDDASLECGTSSVPRCQIALVGLGCRVAGCADRAEFSAALLAGQSALNAADEGLSRTIELSLEGLRIPPNDLAQALPQQLALLQATREAVDGLELGDGRRSAALIGMEPDPEVARYGLRWRWSQLAAALPAAQRDQVIAPLQAPGVLGCMPNIPANRLNATFDLGALGFTVQAGEASGLVALQLALRALARGEIDSAVVGAVDFSCEAVQRAARPRQEPAGDAAVACVFKRLDDAERDGDSVIALVDDCAASQAIDLRSGLVSRFGCAEAAQGLVEFAAAALALHHRRRFDSMPSLEGPSRRISIGRDPQHNVSLQAASPAVARASELRLHVFAAQDRAALIDSLRQHRQGQDGAARIVLLCSEQQYADTHARALQHLLDGTPAGTGVYFRHTPLSGGLAFCFAGAGAAYSGMGRQLLQDLPALIDGLGQRSQALLEGLSWAYDDTAAPTAMQQLQGASALSQLHAELSQHWLGLRADAWLGYSSGETNALFAAEVWQNPDALMADMQASGLMERELGQSFDAVSRVWGREADWANWSVWAAPDEVRAALANTPDVHLAIIHSDRECMIAGAAAACEQVVERIGRARCLPMNYALAVHVPETRAVEAEWLTLHTRPTQAPRSGQIYSSGWGRAYEVSPQRCAEALWQQANHCLDLRPAILQAWDDGVRIFVEHGPGGSYARAIRETLGDREALVLSLDRKGQGIEHLLHCAAALIAAGVSVNLEALQPATPPQRERGRSLSIPGHWPEIRLGADGGTRPATTRSGVEDTRPSPHPLSQGERGNDEIEVQWMLPAPRLPSVLTVATACSVSQDRPIAAVARPAVAQLEVTQTAPPSSAALRQQLAQLAQLQQDFVRQQGAAHQRFLALRGAAMQTLLRAAGDAPGPMTAADFGATARRPLQTAAAPAASLPSPKLAAQPLPKTPDSATPTPATPQPDVQTALARGPQFSREQLLIHAGGKISELFGPAFAHQDGYARQVRMPLPPLLLADRVTGIDAEPDSMGKGRLWTETDVDADAWYLHHGRMPAGVMIEAGQADLMLISYLGIDRFNRGERVYRLLGCELTYHGDLPRVGETISFEITLDGHAAQGDVRLMFFHYDCHNGDRLQLSVREGQAGFFSDAELADSAGCLWTAETQAIVDSPRLDPPLVSDLPSRFERPQLEAFAAGDAFACFGAGFERAQTHSRSPSVHGGRMLLQDRITEFYVKGGPWQRGYLRAELDIQPQHWFFDGHFKNDPCMPGTLMFEGCLQMLAFYLAGCGYTLARDGWRFQPVPELPYRLQCRGQVLPSSKRLVTEVFVEELIAGPIPTVYADLLCTVDGLKAFHARRVALQLVPDWPLDELLQQQSAEQLAEQMGQISQPAANSSTERPVAVVDGFRFDQRALLACALGRPSEAFGPMYRRFDGPTRVARLPSPPYHFISRIAEVEGPIGEMRAGARVVAEYDLPKDVWYLNENGCRRMPFAVLLEAALQPCGWLSSYVGSAITVDAELGFRNLDGSGKVLAELPAGAGTLCTEVKLEAVSATGGMIIETFAVNCSLNGTPVYQLNTVFGFFPPEALAAQAGLPTADSHRELLQRPANRDVDLAHWGDATSGLSLPGNKLRMIDRLQGWWPEAGAAGLGQLRAVKQIDANEWFFKAHFYQDPVQPGSLGLEAMLQLLQVYAIESNLAEGIAAPRFECIGLEREHQWKYRGQVLPHHRQVHTTLEITERGRDPDGAYVVATASLWADGKRIYEASNLSLRVVGKPL